MGRPFLPCLLGKAVVMPTTRSPSPRSRRPTWLPTPVIVVVALVGVLAGLALSVAAVAGVAKAVRVVVQPAAAAKADPVRHPGVSESMRILTGKMDGHPGWPRFTHPTWTVRRGEVVTLRITSYDDGTAPLSGAQKMYDRVGGTLGGSETINGRVVSSLPNSEIAHTFTLVGLGVNLPIPAAPKGTPVTVVARFVATRAGTWVWQCYAPCGSGPNSMGGAMSTKGWMEGAVRVLP